MEKFFAVVFLIIISLFVLLFGINIVGLFRTETITATVIKTESVVTGSKDDIDYKYLVFTDKEVFENEDSLFYWKWNSSDYYANISEGHTYNFKVYGFRIPFLSMYRNIYESWEVID